MNTLSFFLSPSVIICEEGSIIKMSQCATECDFTSDIDSECSDRFGNGNPVRLSNSYNPNDVIPLSSKGAGANS